LSPAAASTGGPAGPERPERPQRPERLRLPLTQPQAVEDTTVLRWPPRGGPPRSQGLLLAPAAGARATNPLLAGVAARLAADRYPVVAFDFASAEAGRRLPDPPARLESAFRDAIGFAAGLLEGPAGARPLVLGGRSMGGRIASQVAGQGAPCAGLVLLGYPLHPPGRPDKLRTAHWPLLRVPVLFVHGDRDQLCDLDLFERERRERLTGAPTRVHLLTGADHGFRVPGRRQADVLDEVAGAVAAWLGEIA
jgi:predicted alpha/beta-hydrolase family hydrolase